MGIRIQVLSILGSVGLLVFVFRLLQQRKLKEEYSLLWLAIAFVFLGVAAWKHGLDTFSLALGIYYPPAALFLVMILGAYLMLMHFSLVFSRQSRKQVEIAQELGLLREEVARLRAQAAAGEPSVGERQEKRING